MESNDHESSTVHADDFVLSIGAVIGQLTREGAQWQVTNFLTPIVPLLLLARGHTALFEMWIVHVLSKPRSNSYLGEPLWEETARAIRSTYDTSDGMILHDFMMRNNARVMDKSYHDLLLTLSGKDAEFMKNFVCCDQKPTYYSDVVTALSTVVGMQIEHQEFFLRSVRMLFMTAAIMQISEVYESYAHIDEWPDQQHERINMSARSVVESWVVSWGFELTDDIQNTLDLADLLFPEARHAPARRRIRLNTQVHVDVVHSVILGAPPDDHFTKEDMAMAPKGGDTAQAPKAEDNASAPKGNKRSRRQ